MREHAVNFGAAQNLSGVLCEPDAKSAVAHAPAVLLWNVGIHHRVGSYRVWVDLARRLAADGFTSLRFDLSGMGDSEVRRTAGADDFDEAMAFVTKRTGHATFAPVGFCSGIDQLHPLGLREPRVVAMGYIESYVYKTRGYYLRYPLRYLRGPLWKDRLDHLGERKALQLFGGLFKKREALAVDPGEAEAAAGGLFARVRPTREEFSRDLRSLRARDVKLLFAYFGLETGVTHRGQFTEMTGLPEGDGVDLVYIGGADHILYRVADRAIALGEIALWMRRTFAAG